MEASSMANWCVRYYTLPLSKNMVLNHQILILFRQNMVLCRADCRPCYFSFSPLLLLSLYIFFVWSGYFLLHFLFISTVWFLCIFFVGSGFLLRVTIPFVHSHLLL
ncbi:hypothetical protein PVAP13_7NG284624 [Panicum virgatum]|uniref:Uncharacterized protein n=1 Tax=Panicum virgatum TaxID=38727 RepID=A0A8T0QCM5_PANVG|nr:hypothetical protein PVAP13_7NG284624 [Panicum virgatum]